VLTQVWPACAATRVHSQGRYVPGNPVRVVIYTAIFGDYDELKEPPAQDIDCDFFCFTDAPRPHCVSKWRIIRVARHHRLHPRIQAKRYKLLSHRVFPGGRLALRYDPSGLFFSRPRYDATIWVDASLSLRSARFAREVRECLAKTSWAMFSHPDRDCIFDEAMASAAMLKYRGLPIEEQVDSYRRRGIQPHAGLYACGVIVRKEPLPAILRQANRVWWAENLKWTYQDQLSLPFVLHQLGIGVDLIRGNLWRNDWFDWIRHKSES
jgi:hypothetical protein